MDKIVRIHIAKIPYEISVDAQEKLKKYFVDIRHELDDNLADEIIADIEVRVTEILFERNIKQDGVITGKDVSAIQEQLGSPKQFIDSQTDDKLPEDEFIKEPKKLLRDTDNAYIGGVASGIGAYFGIDAIFIRLIFIALVFASGLGIVLYLLLWLLVPAAKTSSDKLQMAGQPVTAATLQHYRKSIGERFDRRPNTVQRFIIRIFKLAITIISAFAGLFILVLLGLISSTTLVYPFRPLFRSYGLDYVAVALLWLIGLSLIGLLVSLLIKVWGSRTSHLKISAITLLVTFIVAIAGAVATGMLVYNHFSDEYGNNKVNKALAVDNLDPSVMPTKLVINSDKNLSLTYIVSNLPIHAIYSAYPGLGVPPITITNSQKTLGVNSYNLSQAAPNCLGSICHNIYLPVHVTLYGPAVGTVTNDNGATLWINNANFSNSLALIATNGSTINLFNSYASNLKLTATAGSLISADTSTAGQTNVNVDASSEIDVPATNSLTGTLPSSCAQDNIQVLYLNGYNGVAKLKSQPQAPYVPQTKYELNQESCINSSD